MKKIVSMSLILLVIFTKVAFAGGGGLSGSSIHISAGVSQQDDGNFISSLENLGYVVASSSKDKTSSSWSVSYRKKLVNNFFAEVGYVDLGKTKTNIDLLAPVGKTEADVAKEIYDSHSKRGKGPIVGAGYTFNVNPKIDFSIGAGAFFSKDKNDIIVNNKEHTFSESSSNAYVGFDLNYQVNKSLFLLGDFEHYFQSEKNVNRIGLGLGVKF